MKREDGFTIQEVMVAIVVGSLLVAFSFSAFVFVSKLYKSWQFRSDLQHAAGRTAQTITLDILRSKAMTVSDSTLILETSGGRQVHYVIGGSGVFRDNNLLAPDTSTSVAGSIKVPALNNIIEFAVRAEAKDHVIHVLGKAGGKKSSKQAFLRDAAGL